MKIRHSDKSERPRWSDRAEQPTRNTSRTGSGSMCRRVVNPRSPQTEVTPNQKKEEDNGDNS